MAQRAQRYDFVLTTIDEGLLATESTGRVGILRQRRLHPSARQAATGEKSRFFWGFPTVQGIDNRKTRRSTIRNS
jgi:hypothetical protein